ncbi:acyltransferase family protein [Halalkalibacter kiskunsagensis]|uniref:Acyltransferase family protein n=1 Tax=Halalkalibacter kiskunsagensis TaxID=1548599 RepID=A0ABV6KED1_9BACI
MKKKHVNEISFLRSVACLSIVLLHSIVWGMEYIGFLSDLPSYSKILLDSITVFLYYGTPTFIFITAFILGFSYREKGEISEGFLTKRLKFILIPYLFMAILYATPYSLVSVEQFLLKIVLNIFIGDFHAYFVLIIFQFYLLFVLFKKWLDTYSPIRVILFSLFVNVMYLSFFNFTNPIDIIFSEYIWDRFYWIPFPGWIFYFSLAYYIGCHYRAFTYYITRYRTCVLVAPFLTGILLLYLYHSGLITIHSSKRIDILFHTLSVIVFVLFVSRKMKTIPSLFLSINKYSYGIYLLHTCFMSLLILLFRYFSFNLGIFTIVILFVGSTVASMGTVYYLNRFSFGKYIVGKVNIKHSSVPPVSSKSIYVNTNNTSSS